MKTQFQFENLIIEIEFANISETEAIDCAISNLETEFYTFNKITDFNETLNTISEDFTIKYISHTEIA